MNLITTVGKITEHFNASEFKCSCCGTIKIDKTFVEHLEKFYGELSKLPCGVKYVYINSGYRCNNSSARIKGAFIGDMHNVGAAADLYAVGKDGKRIDAMTLCEVAQKCGFGGIAVIDNSTNWSAIHVDDRQRNDITYANKLWYGNEATGESYKTFVGKSKYTTQIWAKEKENVAKKIEVILDIEGHKYSGLLEEVFLEEV